MDKNDKDLYVLEVKPRIKMLATFIGCIPLFEDKDISFLIKQGRRVQRFWKDNGWEVSELGEPSFSIIEARENFPIIIDQLFQLSDPLMVRAQYLRNGREIQLKKIMRAVSLGRTSVYQLLKFGQHELSIIARVNNLNQNDGIFKNS
jgi:hypothetical protein